MRSLEFKRTLKWLYFLWFLSARAASLLFFHPVQWSSKRNRQWQDAILWWWFTVPLVFKDWQLLASWHLYCLPECSYDKKKKKPQIYLFFFFSLSKASTCGIMSCSQLGKKNATLCIRSWLTFWVFSYFLITWQLLRWSGLSLGTLCFPWYFSYHCLSGFGLNCLLAEGSIWLREWFLCWDSYSLRLPLKSFLRLSDSNNKQTWCFSS